MQKLSMKEHDFLTESVLKTLAQNRITTISEFLQEDTEKLSILSRLSLPEILDIRSQILLRYSSILMNGCDLFNESYKHIKFIPSYLESLDTILEGGIPVGGITELCGLAGSGKTQLCFQLAINCAKKSNYSVLYIDTKGDFSAVRIQKILELYGCNHKEMATIMLKINVVHTWTIKEALQLFNKVKDGIIDNLGMIIIDSLPCLMFQHLGDDNKIGLKLLNDLVNIIRFISKKFKVAVICVNIQTRWLDQDMSEIDVNELSHLVTKEAFVEKRNRCLGKYWQHIPTVFLLIEKSVNNGCDKDSFQIQVHVYKSRLPQQAQQCTLRLNEIGVSTLK